MVEMKFCKPDSSAKTQFAHCFIKFQDPNFSLSVKKPLWFSERDWGNDFPKSGHQNREKIEKSHQTKTP